VLVGGAGLHQLDEAREDQPATGRQQDRRQQPEQPAAQNGADERGGATHRDGAPEHQLDDARAEVGAGDQQATGEHQEVGDDEAVDHPLRHVALAQIVQHRSGHQQERGDQTDPADQREGPRRPVEEGGLEDHPQEAEAVREHPQLGLAGSFLVRYLDLGDARVVADQGPGGHRRGEVQTVGQRLEAGHDLAAEHPHPAGRVAHAAA